MTAGQGRKVELAAGSTATAALKRSILCHCGRSGAGAGAGRNGIREPEDEKLDSIERLTKYGQERKSRPGAELDWRGTPRSSHSGLLLPYRIAKVEMDRQ